VDPVTIAALVLGLEKAIAGVIQIILNAGLSPDDKQAYINRIVAAQQNVPEPKVGLDE
jgi:hypothetical protein